MSHTADLKLRVEILPFVNLSTPKRHTAYSIPCTGECWRHLAGVEFFQGRFTAGCSSGQYYRRYRDEVCGKYRGGGLSWCVAKVFGFAKVGSQIDELVEYAVDLVEKEGEGGNGEWEGDD